MPKVTFLYLITLIVFFGIIFSLPTVGRFLRVRAVWISEFLKNVYYAQEHSRQYQLLFNDYQQVQRSIIEVSELRKENELLRERLSLRPREKTQDLMLAEVIGQGSFIGSETLLINKGLRDGLKGGEAVVVNPDMLVGRVRQVFEKRAVVSLLFDAPFTVPAKTMVSQAKGVVKGEIGRRVILDELSQSAVLQQGEIVVTDNKLPSIPANLLIGKVVEVISKPVEVFKRAQLTLLFDPESLEQVFIYRQ